MWKQRWFFFSIVKVCYPKNSFFRVSQRITNSISPPPPPSGFWNASHVFSLHNFVIVTFSFCITMHLHIQPVWINICRPIDELQWWLTHCIPKTTWHSQKWNWNWKITVLIQSRHPNCHNDKTEKVIPQEEFAKTMRNQEMCAHNCIEVGRGALFWIMYMLNKLFSLFYCVLLLCSGNFWGTLDNYPIANMWTGW